MKKKIAKKGFTLVELLASVILLGLLITGVIFAVSKSINKSKENYYVKQKELITQAGREYFNDNRNRLPMQIESTKCVKLTTLINYKYIDDSIDFKKEKCSVDDAKVCARKVSLTKYAYNTVLSCESVETVEYNTPTISYENDISPSPNQTQKVKIKINYADTTDETKNLPIASYKYTIYKMKGTTRNIDKDEVVGGTENLFVKVSGTKREVVVSDIELKKAGKYYIVTSAKTKAGKNNIQKTKNNVESKTIEITVTAECSKDVIYRANTFENTDTVEKWASDDLAATIEVSNKILRVDIELKKNGEVVDTTTVTKTGEINYPIIGEGEFDYTATAYGENNQICTITAKYKIDKTAPICTVTSDKNTWTNDKQTITSTCSDDASGCATETRTEILDEESNEDYVFDPVVDKAGNLGYCEPIKNLVDKTAPTCTIQSEGTKGSNDWYISDVNIGFSSKSDNHTDASNLRYITTDSPTAPKSINNTIAKLIEDKKSKTYYGYVKDEAGNIAKCNNSVTVKRDTTPPDCSITAEGTKENGIFESDVDISATFTDATSEVDKKGLSLDTTVDYNDTTSLTHTDDTDQTTYYCYVKDKAGHTNSNNITIVKSEAEPTCEIEVSGTLGDNDYYTGDTTVTLIKSDNATSFGMSTTNSVNYNNKTTDSITSDTEGVTYYGFVKSNNGKTATCTSKVIKRYSGSPTCEIEVSGTLGDNDYYTSDTTVTLIKSDNATSFGMSTTDSIDYNRKTTDRITSDTEGTTYYGFVKADNGTTARCTSKVIKRYTSNPSCTIDSSGTLGDNDYYTSDVRLTLNPSANTLDYGLTIDSSATYNGILTADVTEDTEGITYHGYVKNIAGVEKNCSKTVKRIATAPSCSITASGTSGTNGWYTSNVNLTINTSDNTDKFGFTKSATETYDSTEKTLTEPVGSGTSGVTYRGYVKTKSGVTSSCNKTIKIDVPPQCSITPSGTKDGEYYTTTVNLAGTYTKGKSNISGRDLTTSSTASYSGTTALTQVEDTEGTTYYCYVKSQSGLTGTNNVTIKKKSDDVSCSIEAIGTQGDNDWYTSDVAVRLNKSSNTVDYGMTTTNTANYNGTTSGNVVSDTNGVTYYGFVRGADGKTATCSKTIKRYTVAPTCSIAVTEGTLGDNGYYKTNVKLTMTKSANTEQFGFTTDDDPSYNSTATTLTQTANTEGTSYYGYVKNKAGTTASCGPVTIKKDSTIPTCSISVSGTKGDNDWYTSNVDLTLTTSYANSYGFTTSSTASYSSTSKTAKITSDTKGVTYYGYVKSKSGITNSCGPVTIKKDATPPECSFGVTSGTLGNNNWYKTKPTLGFTNVSDSISGLATNAYSISTTSTKNYSTTTSTTVSDTTGTTYYSYVKNKAGLEKNCANPTIKVDTIPPKIKVKATRCLEEINGSSGNTSGGSNGLVDNNNCTYTTSENGGSTSDGQVITSASTSDRTWNSAGVKYDYTITENNFDNAVWQENSSGNYSTTTDLNSTTTSLSKTGTKSLTAGGRRQAKITAKDQAGNESTMNMYANIAGSFNVTFNVNGGTAWTNSTCSSSWTFNSSNKTCKKKVTYGYQYGSMPTPVRTGRTFAGWYTSASGGTRVYPSTEMESLSNVTLYAHWNYIYGSCEAAEANWNNNYGNIKLKADSPTRLEYKKDTASTYTVINNSSSYTTSGLKHYWYYYRIGIDNVYGSCTSNYDNLKPYSPRVYDFHQNNQYTSLVSANCYKGNGTGLLGAKIEDDAYVVDERYCKVVTRAKKWPDGNYRWELGWMHGHKDQPSTSVSGSSGSEKMVVTHYYSDRASCKTTYDSNWNADNTCPNGYYKMVLYSVDRAGNVSNNTTVEFDTVWE